MHLEQPYAALKVDSDGEVTHWQVYGFTPTDTLRRFMMDQFPESEDEVRTQETFDDLIAWAEHRECSVALFPLS